MTAQQPTTRHGAPARARWKVGSSVSNSPGRPALDAWLAKADRVLAGSRNALLSPSTVVGPWDDHRTEQATTLAQLERHFEELLSRLVFGPGRWVLIAEDQDSRYVQVLAYEDGSVIAEVTSDNHLEGEQRWSEDDEEKLVALGWQRPSLPKRPNWLAVFPTISPDIAKVRALLMVTLRTIFGLGDPDRLVLTILSSPLRESTPASCMGPAEQKDEGLGGELSRHWAGENWEDDVWVAELHRLIAEELPRHWARENWQDEVWVAELRRLLEAELRARRGEQWWAANERYMDGYWETATFNIWGPQVVAACLEQQSLERMA